MGSIILVLLCALPFALATPEGPGVTLLGNTTRNSSSGTKVNYTGNGTTAGGYIYNMAVNSTTQTTRWKGYVGNVSGRLVLGDSSGSLLYTWNLNSSYSGEVYATRYSGSVSWANTNCSNTTHIANEDIQLNLTNKDNVSITFASRSHSSFQIGTTSVDADACYAINLNVNSSTQSTRFDEVLLYDKLNNATVYATITESGGWSGYDGSHYDFQLIVPENGTGGYSGTLPYYFYVELV